MRILYVEDNTANLLLVERVAKMGGHEIINRTSGEAALADFDTIAPHLILMDIQLEGEMTGLDAVQELRKMGHNLPIIALTAYAMKGDREKALDAGCDEYLPKPLPINKLVELFATYGKISQERAALSTAEVQAVEALAKETVKTSTDEEQKDQTGETKEAASSETKTEPTAQADIEIEEATQTEITADDDTTEPQKQKIEEKTS